MEQLKDRLARAFWFTLALIFLFESWLWDNVKEWLRALAGLLGLARLEVSLVAFLKGLAPYPTLAVFIVPALAILPLKIGALALIAHGHVLLGIVVIFLAKTLALGVSAFLFDHCREKLLLIPWFARLYALVLRVRAWAHELVEPAKRKLVELRALLKARLAEILGPEIFGPERRSRFLRKFALLREKIGRRRV
jgi:hypothetical protein